MALSELETACFRQTWTPFSSWEKACSAEGGNRVETGDTKTIWLSEQGISDHTISAPLHDLWAVYSTDLALLPSSLQTVFYACGWFIVGDEDGLEEVYETFDALGCVSPEGW